jgi:uncharacterized protein YjbI with pentapeptide repeats
MASESRAVTPKKPPSLLWTPLKIDGWGLFWAAGKCVKAIWYGDLRTALDDSLKAVQCVRFKDRTDGELAWALVYTAMTRAVVGLVNDLKQPLTADTYERLVATAPEADRGLDGAGVALDRAFFDHPGWSDYARTVARQFRHWFVAAGVDDASADRFSRELPRRFTYALDWEWLHNKDLFAKLLPENRRTPFTDAARAEPEWSDYAAWLDDEADRRVFEEDFGLTSVYVPLRAFVETRDHPGSVTRTVGLAEEMLDAWMAEARTTDAVRVVEGDPGAGKSSLARRYAATRFGRHCAGRWWRVVYVPLHDETFVTGKSIEDAAAEYTQRVAAGRLTPLERGAPDGTLLILDGLDELSRGGQFGRDVIRAFMSQVTALLKAWNDRDDARLLVLVCGRPVAVGEIKAEVRADGAVLNLLPFLVNQQTAPDCFDYKVTRADPQGLLEADQREQWYANYATARERTDGAELYAKIKKRGDLDAVTAQPLLNYLVAFLTREAGAGELPGNLCGVYETLLYKVWQRGWDRTQVPAIDKLAFEPFCQLLEAIALAAWHSGNPRSIRVGEVEERLTGEQKTQLETFEKEVKAGVLRLLFAFFLRPGAADRGEQTYEFTHKTFAEYLVARRLVREIDTLADDWRKSAGGRGWKDEIRLQDWVELFGPTALDNDLHKFLATALAAEAERRDRARTGSGKEAADGWQVILAHLLNVAVRDGMPMHTMTARLKPSATFREMNRQALNGEIALLHVLNACCDLTATRSRVPALERRPQDWMGGRWFRPMREFVYRFLNLEKTNWSGGQLANINLGGADLRGADLRGALLNEAYLFGADLRGADLRRADLGGAYLGGADLRGAYLSRAYLSRADLSRADLDGALMNEADLSRAYLNEARLCGADLRRADLGGADLSRAILRGANLTGAFGVTVEQLLTTVGEPAKMPDGEPPKKNWRTAKPRARKKPADPAPGKGAPPADPPDPGPE